MFSVYAMFLFTSIATMSKGNDEAEISLKNFSTDDIQYIQCGGTVGLDFASLRLFYSSSSDLPLTSYTKNTSECKGSHSFSACSVESNTVLLKFIPDADVGEMREISCTITEIVPNSLKSIEKSYSINFTKNGIKSMTAATPAPITSIDARVFVGAFLVMMVAMVIYVLMSRARFTHRGGKPVNQGVVDSRTGDRERATVEARQTSSCEYVHTRTEDCPENSEKDLYKSCKDGRWNCKS